MRQKLCFHRVVPQLILVARMKRQEDLRMICRPTCLQISLDHGIQQLINQFKTGQSHQKVPTYDAQLQHNLRLTQNMASRQWIGVLQLSQIYSFHNILEADFRRIFAICLLLSPASRCITPPTWTTLGTLFDAYADTIARQS